jgi:hypothetical protein
VKALVLLPFLLGTGAFGYWLGIRDRRAAVAAVYDEVVPVLRATRTLLAADPTAASYAKTQAVVQYELDLYESEIRSL